MKQNTNQIVFANALFLLILIKCSPGPSPIEYGYDVCRYCQMIISDQRYGTELVTDKGKVYKFDSVECLAVEYLEENIKHQQIHSLWVTNFAEQGKFVLASQANYLRSLELRSPMGLGLTAFSQTISDDRYQKLDSGEWLEWEEVLAYVAAQWKDKLDKVNTE